ncbi:MAG: phosphodiesterase [Rhodocyclaceae bacterium]
MKIIQISDLHLVAPGATLFGQDPLAHLHACIAHINARHADADLVVLSGDLTDTGDISAYTALRDALGGLHVPWRAMVGNHDHRERFLDVFPDSRDEAGFVQSLIDMQHGRIVLLDTLDQGQVAGHLCARRLAWLDEALERSTGWPVYIFAHHPPFKLGMPAIDACRLRDADALYTQCLLHGGVRHIFAGHVHRPVAGTWRGIPFSAVKGTHHQAALQFSDRFVTRMEPPGCAVILIDAQDVIVHFDDFLIEAEEFSD